MMGANRFLRTGFCLQHGTPLHLELKIELSVRLIESCCE
jgi:hypothetical protein